MKTSTKVFLGILALVALYGAIAGSVALVGGNQPTGSQPLGAATPGTRFPNGLTVGKAAVSPTNVAKVIATTCTLSTTVGNLPLATSSKPFDCPITGFRSGDISFGTLASDGGSLSGTGGVIFDRIVASSTSDYAQVWLHMNMSGTQVASSSFSLATTSFQAYGITTQ